MKSTFDKDFLNQIPLIGSAYFYKNEIFLFNIHWNRIHNDLEKLRFQRVWIAENIFKM
jgi:hypothetical protein